MPGNFLHMLIVMIGVRVVHVLVYCSAVLRMELHVFTFNSIDRICEKNKRYWPVYACGNYTGKGPLNK